MGAVLSAVAAGTLTVDEGDRLAGVIERKAGVTHMREIEERLARVEASQNGKELAYRMVAQ
jgi:hypothetical protein